MKKYAVLLAVALLLMMVAPTFAYNGVTGSVVDSLNSNPWVHGGEVYVYVSNSANPAHIGQICATGHLSASGVIGRGTAPFVAGLPLNGTVDELGAGAATCIGYTGDTLEILIDFECGAGVFACTAPNGNPGSYTRQFTQNPIGINFNTGYIYTGTGPTAVTLQGIDGTTGSLPIAAGLVLVLLAGVTMFVVRRRQA